MTANPNTIHTPHVEWVKLREGLWARPLHFTADGYAAQLKVEPGCTIARHRHTGHVHALNLSGWRELIHSGERIGPGDYVFEPPGNLDSWRCLGDEPCIIHLSTTGRIEYLDDAGNVIRHTDTHTLYAIYLAWCREKDIEPVLSPPMIPEKAAA